MDVFGGMEDNLVIMMVIVLVTMLGLRPIVTRAGVNAKKSAQLLTSPIFA